MSEVEHGGLEGETPVNPYSLLEAVNNSSDTAHMAWLIFLAIMAYLTVAVAGVTHKDLLLETPVNLPILGVQIQQAQFFQFAPVILVLFHLGVISQVVLLARKTLEFDYSVRSLETTDRRTHPLRLEVHNFFFVQAIAGPNRSPIMGVLLHGISWLSLVILPVFLLLYIQMSFLPYHNVIVTWTHRLCLLADLVILVSLGMFMMRMETSFWTAFFRTSVHHPFSFLGTALLLTCTGLFSFFVATVPGERLDQLTLSIFSAGGKAAGTTSSPHAYVFPLVPLVTDPRDGALFGVFHRNLNVTDIDFVPDREVIEGEATVILRNRDLRFARLDRSDLHGADLTGANLDGASLVGADLRWVRLQCADVDLILTGNRMRANCPSARGADFSRARMGQARLGGADLTDARFDEAELVSADLSVSLSSGASFSSAMLDRANFTGGVRLQGANFLLASMKGTDLTGAEMQFADLSNAQMQGAVLSHAQLQGAVLRAANLDAADLNRARLQGADMAGAVLRASDLRGAGIWATAKPVIASAILADASQVDIAPLTPEASEALGQTIDGIDNPAVRIRVKERLAPIMDIAASQRWASSSDHLAWQDLVTSSRTAAGPGYVEQLTGYLASMACRSRWRSGAVATGIARRAQALHFQGNLQQIYERLNASDCHARTAVDGQLLNRLAILVDIQQESRAQGGGPSRPANGGQP